MFPFFGDGSTIRRALCGYAQTGQNAAKPAKTQDVENGFGNLPKYPQHIEKYDAFMQFAAFAKEKFVKTAENFFTKSPQTRNVPQKPPKNRNKNDVLLAQKC